MVLQADTRRGTLLLTLTTGCQTMIPGAKGYVNSLETAGLEAKREYV